MSGLTKKEARAIQLLKGFEPEEGYFLAYSGGKDSDAIKILATLAGVKFEAHHNLTTVDAPETIRYIKAQKDIIIDKPSTTMWELIPRKLIPPTRLARYCCAELKERGGRGKLKITGVRKSESVKRAKNGGAIKIIGKPATVEKYSEEVGAEYERTELSGIVFNDDNAPTRRVVEHCYRTTTSLINPIIEWTDEDVWTLLKYYGCNGNPLYGCGFSRIGCIGCPMASKTRYREFAMYPKFKEAYIRAFQRMVDRRKDLGLPVFDSWRDGESVFKWWMEEDPNQIGFFDEEEK